MNRYTTDLKDRKKVIEIMKGLENNWWEVIEYTLLRECKAEGIEDAEQCIRELVMDNTLNRNLSITLGRINTERLKNIKNII